MLKGYLHRTVSRLERSYGYDAGYLHEVINASLRAVFKFGLFQTMSSHREEVSKDAWYAAKIAATLSEDCGPCTQLVIDMALRDGMSPRVLTALLRGDLEMAGADAELGFRYGVAVAQNTDAAPALSEQAEKRFGKRGLISLAYSVAASRVYPTIKRGLGHGVTCTKVKVSDETVIMRKAA